MAEQQWSVADGTPSIPAGIVSPSHHQAPQMAPRGTLTGAVLTITALLLGYVGLVRLMF